jgi:hypothetical protein
MPLLAKYYLTDGLIRGMWSASVADQLTPQIVPDDPDFGYLILEGSDQQALQEQYVIVDGALVTKPAVTLTASPTPFQADGVEVCTITVTPFVPCTVLVQGIPYALDVEDPAVLLTTDVPTLFEISVPHQAACWGAPMLVEAT